MFSDKISYIVILVIIIVILFVVNKHALFPIYEGNTPAPATAHAPAPAPVISEGDQTIANKTISSDINQMTFDAQLQDVQNKINICNNLVKDINAKIPVSIGNIKINSVSQTTDVEDVGITINTGTVKTISSITNLEIDTGEWTMDIVLPEGKQGATGILGIQGLPGIQGDTGVQGEEGPQGKWGAPK
jgi:hypothetical protein